MFPDHCKEVSVHSADFPLTEEEVRAHLMGSRAYIRTRYVILNRDDQWAVAEVGKDSENSVLRTISSVSVLSLPHETAFVDDPSLDVLSATEMGRIQESVGSRCVVVRGKSEHISFFVAEEPFRFTIFDVVPPRPTKLAGLVEESLRSLLQDRYVDYDVVEVDLNALPGVADAEGVIFPCRASGLEHRSKLGYIDHPPELSDEQTGSVKVVGCSLTARVFKAVYGREPQLVNMCPVDLIGEAGFEGPVLTKCCRVKDGFELRDNVAIVPWGARVSDVARALQSLMDHMSN